MAASLALLHNTCPSEPFVGRIRPVVLAQPESPRSIRYQQDFKRFGMNVILGATAVRRPDTTKAVVPEERFYDGLSEEHHHIEPLSGARAITG